MTAERRFRALHAQRGLLYDREPMHISMEAAALALGAELATRLERTAFPDSHALLYREQISMAQILTSRHFLDIACDPRIPAPTRRAFVDRQIHMTLAVSPDHPNAWRASGRIWIVVRSLADEVRDAGFSRRTPSDNQFNLLRHSSFTAHAETNDAVSDHHPRGPR
ncbi:hypothetical protein [Mycolicibacterium porcinum]